MCSNHPCHIAISLCFLPFFVCFVLHNAFKLVSVFGQRITETDGKRTGDGKTVQFVFYLAYSKCSTSLMMFMCPFIKCDKVNELVFRMYLWFPLYVTMRSLQSVCFHVFFLLRLFVGFVC